MQYIFHILVFICIYTILVISLDLLIGHTGLLSIAHAAFFGIGAYTSALFTAGLGYSFCFGIVAGITIAAVASFLISIPALRLNEDYFVIATFSFQMIIYGIFNNWVNVTQGPLGITSIPQPHLFGWILDNQADFFLLLLILGTISYVIIALVISSPYGRVLRAIKEDEVYAKAFGKNTLRFKIQIIMISAVIAASCGSVYAHYVSYIDPTNFTFNESILLISMVIIGGSGRLIGPMIGALVLVLLSESLRFLGIPGAIAANIRQMIYGIALIVMITLRPQGLVGKYRFGR